MKKLMSYIAIVTLVLTFTACGNKDNEVVNNNPSVNNESDVQSNNETENKDNEISNDEQNNVEEGNKTEENKPVENKPSESKTEENKPVENKPAAAEIPEAPKKETVGNILLKDFKANVNSTSNVVELAEKIVGNSVIPFFGMAIEVEEGFLLGFDEEIKGFKSGAMFGPAIGSIPFVGYVFELENEADVAGFISNLESKANLRWNICTEADEAVSGSVGNKVFFVMTKASFEEPEVQEDQPEMEDMELVDDQEIFENPIEDGLYK